ncbi:Protein translocase subunit SecY [hydrothermal vent metagenome]|uniref:Protein translocase subunit SecY n=1 Tax=hydrothermal vent metagenome TaxID=652676 RepID=A0A3B1CG02_9ZZZZ
MVWKLLVRIFKVPELAKRISFTLGMLFVYRIGSHIPVPGVETEALADFFRNMAGTMFQFFDMFTGSNFSNATIFALGIMPYISSSIILQLLTVVIPHLEKLKKEGESGQKKITEYTRYGTIVLASIQGFGLAFWLESLQSPGGQLAVAEPGWSFRLVTVLTMTAGTAFLMWLGEQITERGIGNGISLIIFAGIVADLPTAILQTFQLISIGQLNALLIVGLVALMGVVIAAITFMESSQRRLSIHYAKRQVGRKQYAGSQSHLPLKVNTSGVIPPIFASSIIMFPATIINFMDRESMPWLSIVTDMLRPGALIYEIIYVAAIFFFCYFYTAIIFNPTEVADNLKKQNGHIPGIRPGHPTAEYIDRVLSRLTFTGAIYLSLVCVIPDVLISQLNVPFYFGGTGLLIVVGVGMDTMAQVESHLVMRHYEGLVKKGALRKRR